MSEGTSTPKQAGTQVLGRYQLLKRIGRGGMGDVWLAEDPRLNRQVAVKTLPIHTQENGEFSQRFEREAQAAAALSHPHILPVHDFGEQALPNGRVMTYIVMPYIAGGSLAEKISIYQRNNQLMPMQEAVSYIRQAAEAIDFAHSKGIVHRDIKPGNMLLRNDGWLLLTDFGIARILSGYEQLTQRGVGFGTPEYMAPEQAQGQAVPASDIYSLAVLAYQLFTGRIPFSADSSYATTMQHLMMQPPPPHMFNPNISPALEQILLHGLAKQVAQRPASAREFAGELQQVTASAPFEGTYIPTGALPTQPQQFYPATAPGTFIAPPPPSPPISKKAVTRRQVLIGGGSAAVVLAGAGGLSLWAIERGKGGQTKTGGTQTSGLKAGTTATTTSATTGTTTQNVGAPIVIQGKHNKPISTLAWSPKQNMLVSAGGENDGNIYLWDVNALAQQQGQAAKEKASLKFDAVSDILAVWSPGGDIIALANAEPTAMIGYARMVVYKSDFSDYAPGFSSDFAMKGTETFDGLAWGTDYFYTVHHPFSLDKIDLNAKDQLLIWDTKQPKQPISAIPLDSLFVNSSSNLCTVGPDKYAYVATNPLLLTTPSSGVARMTLGTIDGILIGDITMVSGQAQWKKVGLYKFDESDQYAPADVGAIAWASFGQNLAAIRISGSHPTTIKVFDFETKTYQEMSQHANATGGLTTIAWTPVAGNKLLAAGSEDGKIDIWDYSRSKLPTKTISPPASVTGDIKALAWSSDGVWLAVAYTDDNASLVIWKIGG